MDLAARAGCRLAVAALCMVGTACAMTPVSYYDFSPQGEARHDQGPRVRRGDIRGYAFDERTREPIEDLELRLCRIDRGGCNSGFSLEVFTDQYGLFLYKDLPPGRYRVEAPGYAKYSSYEETEWDVTVRDGEIIQLRAPMAMAASFKMRPLKTMELRICG